MRNGRTRQHDGLEARCQLAPCLQIVKESRSGGGDRRPHLPLHPAEHPHHAADAQRLTASLSPIVSG